VVGWLAERQVRSAHAMCSHLANFVLASTMQASVLQSQTAASGAAAAPIFRLISAPVGAYYAEYAPLADRVCSDLVHVLAAVAVRLYMQHLCTLKVHGSLACLWWCGGWPRATFAVTNMPLTKLARVLAGR
jgi:hypothetical protein